MFQVLAIALLGWVAGALVNYLADVLPVERRLAFPRCHSCGDRQGWDNYLFWPRRCLSCGQRRPARVWIVDLLFIVVTTWLWLSPPPGLGFWASFFLLIYFALVTIIDVEHRLILHPVSLVGSILGLAIGLWLHGPWRTLAGGAGGLLFMLLLYLFGIFYLRLKARSKGGTPAEEALGFGDVILSGVLGLILGWPGILAGLVLTILLSGAYSLVYLVAMLVLRRYQPGLAIPYGPFLVLGAVLLLFFR